MTLVRPLSALSVLTTLALAAVPAPPSEAHRAEIAQRATVAADPFGDVGLQRPEQVDTDAAGNVYVYDREGQVIVRYSPDGHGTVIAGNGETGQLTAGPATATPFGWIEDMAVAADGTVYVVDHPAFAAARITPDGVLSIIDGATWGTPSGIGVDAAGNVYVADCGSRALRRISPAGEVSVLMDQSSVVPGWKGSFFPETIEVTPDGTVYVEDVGNRVIDRVDPDGSIGVFAGSGDDYARPRPGAAKDTTVYVTSMSTADDGTLFFTGLTEGVGRITPDQRLAILDVGGPQPSPTESRSDNELVGVGGHGEVYLATQDDVLRRADLAGIREYDPLAPHDPGDPPTDGRAPATISATYRVTRRAVQLTVTVDSDAQGTPSGRVHLQMENISTAEKALRDGTVQLKGLLPWRSGRHEVLVSYSGDDTTAPGELRLQIRVRPS